MAGHLLRDRSFPQTTPTWTSTNWNASCMTSVSAWQPSTAPSSMALCPCWPSSSSRISPHNWPCQVLPQQLHACVTPNACCVCVHSCHAASDRHQFLACCGVCLRWAVNKYGSVESFWWQCSLTPFSFLNEAQEIVGILCMCNVLQHKLTCWIPFYCHQYKGQSAALRYPACSSTTAI